MSRAGRYRVYGVDRFAASSGDAADAEYRLGAFDTLDEAVAFARLRAAQPHAASADLCDAVGVRDEALGSVLFYAQRPPLSPASQTGSDRPARTR